MRIISPVLLIAAIAGCTAAPQAPVAPSPRAQAHLAELLAGKVAQPPVSCLPHYNANDMTVIDDNTIAFKVGTGRVYINHPEGGCYGIGTGHTALATHLYGGSGICRGDIAQVVDTFNHQSVGSCVWGDFVPFVRPGA